MVFGFSPERRSAFLRKLRSPSPESAKYDGFRAHCRIEDGNVELVSRKNIVYKSFPRLCENLRDGLLVRNAILDGEIVHLDENGVPRFMPLLRRQSPQTFVAFDVLWLDGEDLTTTCPSGKAA